jgi:hypothetical protein
MTNISSWVALQFIYGEMIDIIEKLFASRQYCFMPIKGAYLIRAGLTEGIADRKMVDVDILIPENQFEEVCAWFQTIDGVLPEDNYWNFERSFFYQCMGFPVLLEFHRLLNFPARFLLPNELLFKRSVKVSDSCFFPDPIDALLIHICHKLAHVINGFEEQFYNEISLYVSHTGFSWKEFWERAEATGIFNFIWLVLEKWKKKKKPDYFFLPECSSFYAAIISKTNLFMTGRNPLIRKIFFEVPFVRNRIKLLIYKIRETYLKKHYV